jgi:hypothetical protein
MRNNNNNIATEELVVVEYDDYGHHTLFRTSDPELAREVANSYSGEGRIDIMPYEVWIYI